MHNNNKTTTTNVLMFRTAFSRPRIRVRIYGALAQSMTTLSNIANTDQQSGCC